MDRQQQSSSLASFFPGREVSLADTQQGVDPDDLGQRRTRTSAITPSALWDFDGQQDSGAFSKLAKTTSHLPKSLPMVKKQPTRRLNKRASSNTEEVDAAMRLMGHTSGAVDVPSMRSEAVRLEERYVSAMGMVDVARGRPSLLLDSSKRSDIAKAVASDFFACSSEVSATMAQKTRLTEALDHPQEGVFDWPALAEEACGANAIEWWRLTRDELAATSFERQWSNATCAELAAQVTVGCLEQGRLLETVRQRYSSVFARLSTAHLEALRRLECCFEVLGAEREAAFKERERSGKLQKLLESKQQEALGEAQVKHKAEIVGLQAQQKDQEDSAGRMGETFRTLNGLFRDMQQNGEQFSKNELRDRLSKSQARLGQAEEEIADLRKLRLVAARLPVVEGEMRMLKSSNADLAKQLEQAQTLVRELQTVQFQIQAQEEKLKGAEADGNEGDLAVKFEDEDDDDEKPLEDPLASVLCLKCKRSLDDMSNIRSVVEAQTAVPPPRLVCHAYRSFLPSTSKRPERSLTWVRRCMRSILHAVILDHASTEGTACLPTRFPEFVYSFFEPRKLELDKCSRSERAVLIAEADDDRSGLYYGVKFLSRESDESKLFWALLDETHGDDFLGFVQYSLSTLRKCAGSVLSEQLGAAWKVADHFGLKEETKSAESRSFEGSSTWDRLASSQDADALANGGQQTIWVPLGSCVKATERVLIRANPKMKEAALESTRSIAVEANGRVAKWGASAAKLSLCVDVSLWLRVLSHLYREEQAHRRAATRLMFSTALAGTVTDQKPDYGAGREPSHHKDAASSDDLMGPPPCVDLPQFVSIVRTLWPWASTAYACRLYRECHTASKGKVDYLAFLSVAENQQFFTQSLSLPPYVAHLAELELPFEERGVLGSLVHLRERMMAPLFDRIQATLPEGTARRFELCRNHLNSTLLVNTTQSSREIDGLQPLAAYKRLLFFAHHARLLSYELGMDYPEGSPSGLGYAARLSQKMLSAGDFVTSQQREIKSMELALIDYDEPQSWGVLSRLQLRLATTRVAHSWRRRTSMERGPPRTIRILMRRGYMSRRGETRDRRVYRSPLWVQEQIALVEEAWLNYINTAVVSSSSFNGLNFPRFVHAAHVARYGLPSLAERALHDLYLNARHLAKFLPRARLFCVLSGLSPSDLLEDDARANKLKPRTTSGDEEAHWDNLLCGSTEAASFYVRSVLLLRRHSGYEDSGPLFPATDFGGDEDTAVAFWKLNTKTLLKAAHELFDDRLGGSSRSPEFDVIGGELERIAHGNAFSPSSSVDEGRVADVDEFLVIVMRHWAASVEDRRDRADTAARSSEVMEGGASLAMQSTVGFEKMQRSLKIKVGVAPEQPAVQVNEQDEESSMREYAAGWLGAQRRSLQCAAIYAGSLLTVEGAAASSKVRLDFGQAATKGLEAVSFEDMCAEWVVTSKGACLYFDADAESKLLYSAWDDYSPKIDLFLAEFEDLFCEEQVQMGRLEKARDLLKLAKRAVSRSRSEDRRAIGHTRAVAIRYGALHQLWAQVRTIFETVHYLRGSHRDHTTKQIAEGSLDADKVHPDLLENIGWSSSWEFLRDEWTLSSPENVIPPPSH